PYTVEHVVTQLQLLVFSALAFTVLMRTGLYPPELRSTNLDSDWLYRRGLKRIVEGTGELASRAVSSVTAAASRRSSALISELYRHHGPSGWLARTWPTGAMAFWATVLLATYLIAYYVPL
ncbi:MAG: Na(+)/H(+) antiporter subunit D, partial [Rhizobiales bacterium]|nr:Na(+)/H(+) antiporter subunit D [Hyphomicrobiales bacterium]